MTDAPRADGCWKCGHIKPDCRPVGDNPGETRGGGTVMWRGDCSRKVAARVDRLMAPVRAARDGLGPVPIRRRF